MYGVGHWNRVEFAQSAAGTDNGLYKEWTVQRVGYTEELECTENNTVGYTKTVE